MSIEVGGLPSRGALAGRAIVALLLLIGFYAMALGIAGGLLYALYFMVTVAHRANLKVALFLLVGAGAILWGILPRFDRFEAPGPRLTPERHPRLFALLQDVARSTRQALPADVYLVGDMNAWVSQRGGIMGFGSRRIMGLGLPLLQVLTAAQLRGVLAHEFGHYHGGDVKLGPWIYKTRAAIGRTLLTLANTGSNVLHKPFEWYGALFLRVTHAISRNQEYQADALAAKVAGAAPLIEGLKAVHGAGLAFRGYLNGEFAPAIEAGYLPPLAEGFKQFVSARDLKVQIDRAVEEALNESEVDPYDTHPPLADRIAALTKLPQGNAAQDSGSALSLLDDQAAVERDLLKFILVRPERISELRAIDWKDVGQNVYPVLYRASAEEYRPQVGDLAADTIPLEKKAMTDWAGAKLGGEAMGMSDDDVCRYAIRVFVVMTTLLLVERKWVLHTSPGEAILARKDAVELAPGTLLQEIADGKQPPDAWMRLCERAGLVGVRLADAGRGDASHAARP